MNILITGGGGFIGKAFCNYFTEHTLFPVRHASTFSIDGTKIFANLTNRKHIDLIANELKKSNIQIVFHLAGITPFYKKNYKKNYNSDILMAKNITILCNILTIKRLYISSGWNVYDPKNSIPFKESDLLNPGDDYGKSKLEVEEYIQKYPPNAPFTILRIASVYGPGQQATGLIPTLIKTGVYEKKLTLSSIETKRDYIYILDLLKYFKKIIESTSLKSNILNVGSNTSYKIIEVAESIQQLLINNYNKKIEIKYKSSKKESIPPDNRLSTKKLNEFVKRSFHTNLLTGLDHCISWEINKVIIFDLDGTLINVRERLYSLHLFFSNKYNLKTMPINKYWKCKRAGLSEKNIMKMINSNSSLINKYVNERLDHIEDDQYLSMDQLKNGVIKTLSSLSKKYCLILLTQRKNKVQCLKQLKELSILKYFDQIKISGLKTKSYIIQTELKDTIDKNTILIGDTGEDADVANKFGFRSILLSDGIRNMDNLLKANPAIITSSIDKLEKIIEN